VGFAHDLIGGEVFLKQGWIDIVRAFSSSGVYCAIQTGGFRFPLMQLEMAAKAGLHGVGVSIDGLEHTHDRLRGKPGAYKHALRVIGTAKALGLNASVNTQINVANLDELENLFSVLVANKVGQWQVQLTVPMGNAVDNADLLLQPYQLAGLIPRLAELSQRGDQLGLALIAGNNIGYFGPYEHILRRHGDAMGHWTGCTAGNTALGVESDGTIKGCPSLPTNDFAAGNIKNAPLDHIIGQVRENLHQLKTASSQGARLCGSCYYATICRGGCTWTAHSLAGKPGDNPFCHFRVLKLLQYGYRERVVRVLEADKQPFSIGRFEVILEYRRTSGWERADPADLPNRILGGNTIKTTEASDHHEPRRLILCNNCKEFNHADEMRCAHCGSRDLDADHRISEYSPAVAAALRILEWLRRGKALSASNPDEA
jgi:radical SAM protein with 4Fe4S-binding SPASM domain